MTDAIDQPDVTMTGRLSTRDLPGGSSGSLRVPALIALPDGPLLLVHDHRPRPGAGAWLAAWTHLALNSTTTLGWRAE